MPTDEDAAGSSRPVEPAAHSAKRDVVITGQFKKDMKREQKGLCRAMLRTELQAAVDMLANDVPLPADMADHPL